MHSTTKPTSVGHEVRYIRGGSGDKLNIGAADITVVSTKFFEASSTGVTKAHQLLGQKHQSTYHTYKIHSHITPYPHPTSFPYHPTPTFHFMPRCNCIELPSPIPPPPPPPPPHTHTHLQLQNVDLPEVSVSWQQLPRLHTDGSIHWVEGDGGP